MKSVTAGFTSAWASRDKIGARRILLYRRYFDTNTNTFVREGSSTTITDKEIESVGNITWKLDTEILNQFSASNVVLSLKNNDNQWSEFNEKGRWAPDSTAKLGYIPFLSKFVVQAGYEVGGSIEYVDIFTGYVGDDMIADTESATMSIPIIDGRILLRQADAEEVSTLSAVSAMTGTINGINKIFFSTATGVGRITVFLNGVEQELGSDYVVEQMNDPANFAKVTFTIAPPSLSSVTHQVSTWFSDKKIDFLVRWEEHTSELQSRLH